MISSTLGSTSGSQQPFMRGKHLVFETVFIVISPHVISIINLHYNYRIRSIRRRGYYLFHRPSLCGVYSRAATIRERRLLIPVLAVASREAILRETVD